MQMHTLLGIALADLSEDDGSFRERCETMLHQVPSENREQSAWARRTHLFRSVPDIVM